MWETSQQPLNMTKDGSELIPPSAAAAIDLIPPPSFPPSSVDAHKPEEREGRSSLTSPPRLVYRIFFEVFQIRVSVLQGYQVIMV